MIGYEEKRNCRFIPDKPKKKRWIVLVVLGLVVGVLLGYASFIGYNYFSFEHALESYEFINAYHYYNAIPFRDNILSEEYEYMNAGILMEEGKYIEAYSAFMECQDRPVAESIISGLKDKIYSLGQTAYRAEKYSEAREYFNIVSEHKRSGDYLLLIDCSKATTRGISENQYKLLLKLLDEGFENADEIILETDDLLTRFLTARWEDDENHLHWVNDGDDGQTGHAEFFGPYYFEIDKNSAYFNLPHEASKDSFNISEGHFLLGKGHSMKRIFRFAIIDQYTISVYCYYNGSTHTLYRK